MIGSRKRGKGKALLRNAVVPISALILSLILGCFIILAMGISPVRAMGAMARGAFGSLSAWGETIVKMTPILCTGVSFALANRCGLINIGGEGQLYIGGLCAMAVALYLPGLPLFIHLPLCVLAGFLGGGLWGMLAGFLLVRFGTNEMISTIMLNYIATFFINFMVTQVMLEPPGTMPRTAQVPESAQLPRLFSGLRIHIGIFIALGCVLIYYFFLWKTKSGFQTRVVGFNPHAARYAGINDKKQILLAMLLSGGFAGLAGMIELLGVQLRMYQNFSPGYGFDGIAVALLGQCAPVGIIFSALMFGALGAGSNLMQMTANVPSALIYIVQALVIVFVVSSQYVAVLRKKWHIKKQSEG